MRACLDDGRDGLDGGKENTFLGEPRLSKLLEEDPMRSRSCDIIPENISISRQVMKNYRILA
jgi:hypothetical protein